MKGGIIIYYQLENHLVLSLILGNTFNLKYIRSFLKLQ